MRETSWNRPVRSPVGWEMFLEHHRQVWRPVLKDCDLTGWRLGPQRDGWCPAQVPDLPPLRFRRPEGLSGGKRWLTALILGDPLPWLMTAPEPNPLAVLLPPASRPHLVVAGSAVGGDLTWRWSNSPETAGAGLPAD